MLSVGKNYPVSFVIAFAAVVAGALLPGCGREAGKYQWGEVSRGDLLVTIGATGTIEPEEVIDVGAQVLGRILSFGVDAGGKEIDYGALVEEGTVLARIDDSLYAADVAQDEAQVKRAQADLLQTQAKLMQAEQDWSRAQKVGVSEALARTTYDRYRADFEVAGANVAISEAAVSVAEAALEKARRNLSYCTITSPVKGVIIDRRVNIGQTVVASLNAPSLFLIAKDLTRLEVWVAVNEADIGMIRPGLKATFVVDAFPGEVFHGEVRKIRLNASMTQNVVTYTVEVSTDNSSGRLLPYLTANVQFEVNNRKNVMLVPNAALRWSPEGETPLQTGPDASQNMKRVWVEDGSSIRQVRVRAGGSDGTRTEIESEELKEGMRVVLGEQETAETATGSANPFTPVVRPGRRGS